MIQIAGTEEELVESRAYIWYYKTIKQKGGISIGDIYDGMLYVLIYALNLFQLLMKFSMRIILVMKR